MTVEIIPKSDLISPKLEADTPWKNILAQLAVLGTHGDALNRLKIKIALTRRLYKKGWQKKDIFNLYKFIDWLITLPEELMIEYEQAAINIEEGKQVAYISSGERVGIMKGLQQGMQQGLQQGEAAIIIRLLTRRFGEIPAQYIERIQQTDAETLLGYGEKILEAISLEEIFNQKDSE